MPEIRQLPPLVVNKIAAGEVIERPASVVKELLENSIDAQATRVDLSVEKGGAQLMRVADNGCGIAADQLSLAVASHATSKIRDAEDLFQVQSLGFRGEALASIAAVSQLELRTRTQQAEGGAHLVIHGGQAEDVQPCGCPVGTTVEVRNLFYNTPARRKFLRSTQTEMGHISEAFTRVALAHPEIHFTLRHNDKLLHELPGVESLRERIARFFGDELNDGLIHVERREEDLELSGYVAEPSFSRSNNRMQYLFLNGRHIRDRSLQHALGEAYRGLLLTGRFPIAFLRLKIPPGEVDVNVHPAKLEVRFQDGGRIYSHLLGSLRNQFLRTDLTAKVQSPSPAEPAPKIPDVDPRFAQQHRDQLTAWAKGMPAPVSSPTSDSPQSLQGDLDLRFDRPNVDHTHRLPGHADRPAESVVPPRAGDPTLPATTTPLAAQPLDQTSDWAESGRSSHVGLQVHNRYLVTENESGVVIIDQHALHERILYEQLREKVLSDKMETQRLLVPEPVPLSAAEAGAVLDAQPLLAQLGIDVEAFGGDTVLVSSYPAMLANLGPAEMLRQLVEPLMTEGKQLDRRDLLDSLLHRISCKAAVKAGDHLTAAEVHALLEHRELCQDAHHCPHGRPTALVFSREELDRRFQRT